MQGGKSKIPSFRRLELGSLKRDEPFYDWDDVVTREGREKRLCGKGRGCVDSIIER